MEVKPRLIIGLGNPGKEYEKTYHNAGFLFVDYLINSQLPITNYKLLKTDVYMNQSGNFVKKTLKKYKIKPEEILIVHDDSDIELGKYKISFGRGSAGHNGVQSIIDALKTKNFWRLRIGIGRRLTRTSRELTRKKARDFVLKKINKKDLKILEKLFFEISI
ncbi:MAG: aminoacyl-tRNA hydrolase [Patescibacteria group bacterium]